MIERGLAVEGHVDGHALIAQPAATASASRR